MERVRQRRPDPAQHLELVDGERGLAAAGLRGRSGHTDDVAEVDVDLAGALDRAEELNPAAAVDEVEERQLPHVAARQDAARQAALGVGLCAGLETRGFLADARDLVAIGEALGRGHPRESRWNT